MKEKKFKPQVGSLSCPQPLIILQGFTTGSDD